MERLHLRPRHEAHTGSECKFCRKSDPQFDKRMPMDRLVCSKDEDAAAGHVTENGYVRHRLLEIEIRLATAT